MNKERRNKLNHIVNNIENIKECILEISEKEEEAKDGIDGYPQFEYKVDQMEINIDLMSSANDSLDEVINFLKDVE